MIVVDVNVLAYTLINGIATPWAEKLRVMDPRWAVPSLWTYEFENILASYLRRDEWDVARAMVTLGNAASLLSVVRDPSPKTMFGLVGEYKITAYDAQYVALAMELKVPLVTEDKELVRKFQGVVYSMEGYWGAFGNRDLREPAGNYVVSTKRNRGPRKRSR